MPKCNKNCIRFSGSQVVCVCGRKRSFRPKNIYLNTAEEMKTNPTWKKRHICSRRHFDKTHTPHRDRLFLLTPTAQHTHLRRISNCRNLSDRVRSSFFVQLLHIFRLLINFILSSVRLVTLFYSLGLCNVFLLYIFHFRFISFRTHMQCTQSQLHTASVYINVCTLCAEPCFGDF